MAQARAGTSLIEVLIACTMVTVAILGLLGSSARVSQQMGSGRRQLVAASIAQRRLDSLQSVPCARLTAASGGATTGEIREEWQVSGTGATRLVQLSLHLPQRRHPYVYATLVACQ
jgi:Tfp pilus assembly protein PilV